MQGDIQGLVRVKSGASGPVRACWAADRLGNSPDRVEVRHYGWGADSRDEEGILLRSQYVIRQKFFLRDS